jgi:hypothetical protein
LVCAPGSATAVLATLVGAVDVAALGRALQARRGRLGPPDDVAVWRVYLWGRLTELVATPGALAPRDPLVAVWVRGDDAAALGADHLEITATAVTPSGARATAIALVRIGPRGVAIVAVWPGGGVAAGT